MEFSEVMSHLMSRVKVLCCSPFHTKERRSGVGGGNEKKDETDALCSVWINLRLVWYSMLHDAQT